MKNLHVGVLSALFLTLAPRLATATEAAAAVEDTLHAYEQDWSRHDGHAVARFYYEPAMRVTNGGPIVRATLKDEEAFFETARLAYRLCVGS